MRASAMLFAVLIVALPSVARAEPTPEEKARARSLFDEGRALMAEARWPEARARLEGALAILPGKGIEYNLAICYEKLERFASAWALYREVAAVARDEGDGDRERLARSRADAVAPRVSRLTVVVAHPVDGLVVTKDGAPVASGSWGTPVPVDAGEHLLRADAPGHESWEAKIAVAVAGSASADVPELAVIHDAPIAPVIVTPPPPERVAPRARPLGGQRIAALAVGGVGVASIVGGTFFLVRSVSRYGDANAYCNSDDKCTDTRGVTLRDDAIRDGNIATIAYAAGAGALVGAALLYWLAPRDVPVGLGPGGVRGQW
jgi:hypothetical protein